MSTATREKAPSMKKDKPKQVPTKTYDPVEDGVTHINVYTKGKTKIGRDCSNLQECNIEHPYLGRFRTLEGLWYYTKTGCQHEIFRVLNGHDARKRGKPMPRVDYPLFNKMFKLGIVVKLENNPELQKELVASGDIELTHYYVYQDKILTQPHHEWQIEFWKILRDALKATGSVKVIRDELTAYIDRYLANKDSVDDSAEG